MISKKLLKLSDKIIYVDMDGTLTKKSKLEDFENSTISQHSEFFKNVKPNKKIIKLINELFFKNWITIYTTRIDYHENVTKDWLKKHNVKYDNIIFNKPYYDVFIDDKNINVRDLK